jgi:hypothetical protein
MSRNPNRGRVYRRCACRDTAGRQLGAHCPELTNRRHGRWAFAIDLPNLDGGRRTMRRCGFPTKAQAHAALHRVMECERAGVHVDDRQTLTDYLNTWLGIKQRSLKPTTLARYRDYVDKDLSPALGPIRLEELTHHHVAGFVSNQLAAGRGLVTVHRCVATLRPRPRAAAPGSDCPHAGPRPTPTGRTPAAAPPGQRPELPGPGPGLHPDATANRCDTSTCCATSAS